MKTPEMTAITVRHGQTTGNLTSGRYQGRSSHLQLTHLGAWQATASGLWLKDTYGTPDAVVVSPAVRTIQTAEIILDSARVQIDPIISDRLQEIDRGEWEGELYAEKETPEVKRRMRDEGMDYRTPGGESVRDVQVRMQEEFMELPEGMVWVISHGMAIRALVGHIKGQGIDDILDSGRTMYNTSATEVYRTDAQLMLGRYALTEHLPDGLLTT